MKIKMTLAMISLISALPAMAVIDIGQPLPEPSTIGLFVAAAIAITLLAKLKK